MKPGDRVQLISGGAIMTVETVDGENVRCVWQETGGTKSAPKYKTHRETFSAVTLRLFQRFAISAGRPVHRGF